ncbi:cytochrome C oxidase subunit IV family protein [Nocardia sp. NBC_01388]|uniref:cytochrome C oxidase subunit IV family protein n=1 Tax=Nocardia sp. NBC_01388 TaxID=2903596 RepID=UPI003255C55D
MNTPIARARRLQPATRRNAIVWIALMAITIVWWQLTPEDHGSATASGKVLVSAIAALGMIKSRLIIRYFMEIRTAPRWLRFTTDGWIVVLWLGLLGVNLYR